MKGVPGSNLMPAIVASWLASGPAAPKRSDVTIAGQKLVRVAFSQGPVHYLLARGGIVLDLDTTDETLVATMLPLLK